MSTDARLKKLISWTSLKTATHSDLATSLKIAPHSDLVESDLKELEGLLQVVAYVVLVYNYMGGDIRQASPEINTKTCERITWLVDSFAELRSGEWLPLLALV